MNMHTWKPLFTEETIRKFYFDYGFNQHEVGIRLGVSRKVIDTLMRHYSIPRRKAAKRDQFGEKNHKWKGMDAGYQAFHLRVESRRGRPSMCSNCGAVGGGKTYEWANLTGNYADSNDYARMCRSCHRKYDYSRRK